MRVLIVEDDPNTSKALQIMLAHANIKFYSTDMGAEAVELAMIYQLDLILLNIDLPDISGYDVVEKLRSANAGTPILILSSRNDIESKVNAFRLGVDDYLTKPFHREELLARIHAIIRRSNGHAQSIISTGKLAVNLTSKTVCVGDQSVHLTMKEYQVLELLSLRKGTTITKEMFLDHLYGGLDEPELKIIDVFICKLRKKLRKATGGEDYIDTIWGRGYVFQDSEVKNIEMAVQ